MQKKEIRCIAVLTSGGDAPGMNAAIRAVTRAALANNITVFGINYGFQGMIENDFLKLSYEDIGGIISLGGTILKTARCKKFMTYEGREKAYQNLKEKNIDGVVVIGGDGSFKGAAQFSSEFNIPFIGIPGTIDNDINGTDYTIGFDTALNTVVQAVDKIKDTARSHGRIFFVESMGREAGLLALGSGLACGAEVILIPEVLEQEEALDRFIHKDLVNKKTSGIIMVAEGYKPGGALKIAERVKAQHPDIEARVTILGHIQRGGSPTAQDRIVATRMGIAAVSSLLAGKKNLMIGLKNQAIVEVAFGLAEKAFRPINKEFVDIQEVLTRD
ncbi:MAG: 6-phosphofructokinase [Bacteroidales bacterium]|nr:6-phosphofructokinase [Bacteroidales bacterium]MDD3891144.1 6-phosphofructokinase [Bacteroidales bacterium]